MKRYLVLLCCCAAMARAEEAKLPRNVIMQVERSLVSVKAGTVLQIVKRDAKTLTVKVDGKIGTIPADSFAAVVPEPPKWGNQSVAAPTKSKSTPTPVASTPEPAPAAPAVSLYGRAIEKTRQVTDQHEKAMVTSDGELLEKR